MGAKINIEEDYKEIFFYAAIAFEKVRFNSVQLILKKTIKRFFFMSQCLRR